MLGKIFDQGEQTHIFSVIVKTSNTGLFSNKRLGLLALKTAQIGYHSKVPDQLQQYENPNCMQQCKETINIKAVKNFTYYLNPDAKNVLILKWQDEKDKTWEFKFDNEEISSQWYNYITNVLYPPPPPPPKEAQKPPEQPSQNTGAQKVQPSEVKPESPKVDYSKLQKPSRFQPNEKQPEHVDKKQEQLMKIAESKQYEQNPSDLQRSPSISNFSIKTKSPNRFKSYEEQNSNIDQSMDNMRLPIITTFREKFPNQNIFNSLNNRNNHEENNYQGNWNLRWYQAIQTEQQQARIKIYNQFLQVCETTCLQIIKELTKLKKERKLIPERVTMNEEIYKSQQIDIRLIMQRDIDFNSETLCNSHHFKTVRQELENLKFILKATKNKGFIKVPLACQVTYLGFYFFCEASLPSNYTEVQHNSKYLFQKQINRLEQQLKLRISLANINLYTNKPNSSPQSKANRASYLVARGLKNLLPSSKAKGVDNMSYLPRNIFLDSYEILSVNKDSSYYDQIKDKLYTNFLKSESIEKCSIISYQDLISSLNLFNIPLSLIDELIPISNNRYINKIIMTEIVSDIICYIIRSQINKFLKSWNSHLVNMESNELPDYKNVIFKIMDQFFSDFCLYNVWNTINNIVFQNNNLTVRKQDIIVGYLLSSISIKTGIEFDYQLMIHQRHRFFLQGSVIPTKAILQHHPVFLKYQVDEMCMSYEQIIQELSDERVDEHKLEEVVSFFNLKSAKTAIQPYLWGKICKYISLFVPYDKQQDYKHLSIYSCLNLFYLDYNIFSIMVSAIKWLLHESRLDDALELVFFFKDISWFWVSQTNPFLIVFYDIIAEYYRTKKSLKQSIQYLNLSQQSLYHLYKTEPQLESLDKNYQLAQAYMLCNMHKEALSKFREVKHTMKKFDKQSLVVLDVLAQISKLYLHLSDLDRCIRYCRETIDYSILNPFKNEEQQFEIYSVLIRALQIKDQQHKYKFYIDIMEQKFNKTNNSYILHKVLKLTCQQYLQSIKPYYLKKLAFLIYFYESKQLANVDGNASQHTHLFRMLKKIPVKHTLSRYLRECLDKSVDIIDELVIIQQKQKRHEHTDRIQFEGDAENLRLICSFVGFDYIVGQIVVNLKKKDAI